jgi:hypothetical protein
MDSDANPHHNRYAYCLTLCYTCFTDANSNKYPHHNTDALSDTAAEPSGRLPSHTADY